MDEADVEHHISQSIVVRLWLEHPGTSDQPSDWHARITHVPTGESQTVSTLAGIAGFCAQRLESVNARVRWQDRFWLRLNRRGDR